MLQFSPSCVTVVMVSRTQNLQAANHFVYCVRHLVAHRIGLSPMLCPWGICCGVHQQLFHQKEDHSTFSGSMIRTRRSQIKNGHKNITCSKQHADATSAYDCADCLTQEHHLQQESADVATSANNCAFRMSGCHVVV